MEEKYLYRGATMIPRFVQQKRSRIISGRNDCRLCACELSHMWCLVLVIVSLWLWSLVLLLSLHGQSSAARFVDLRTTLQWPSAPSNDIPDLLDAVLVASLDDAEVFVEHALPSIVANVKGLRFIFVVCQPEMCTHLEERRKHNHKTSSLTVEAVLDRVLIVPEDEPGLFPFSLEDLVQVRQEFGIEQNPNDKNRDKWTLQQLLKLYAPVVLATTSVMHPNRPSILPTVLIADADTVWAKPVSFVRKNTKDGAPQTWHSIASIQSGAFRNDARFGEDHLAGIFGLEADISESCVSTNVSTPLIDGGRLSDALTAITHHAVFQRHVIFALLEDIAMSCGPCRRPRKKSRGGCKPWSRLAAATPFLSEFELYIAYASSHFPETVALRALPYVNMGFQGLVPPGSDNDPSNYHYPVHLQPTPSYLTLHDDYAANVLCCVNTVDVGEPRQCNPCSNDNEGTIPVEIVLLAVQRLNMCQRVVYPVDSTIYQYIQHLPSSSSPSEAHARISEFVSCVRDGRFPEDDLKKGVED